MKNAMYEYLATPFASSNVQEKVNDRQVENNTGGFVYRVSDEQRLTRFLVLGTEAGSYYAGRKDMTKDNAKFIIEMIKNDEKTVLDTVVDVSVNARAPKNSSALFVLALVFAYGQNKVEAQNSLTQVARTGTHLFEFVSYLKAMGGLGRAKRRAIATWYTSKSPEALGLQVAKYRNRNGFTHRDLLRLSHAVGLDQSIGEFILNGKVTKDAPSILMAFEHAQTVTSDREAIAVINGFKNVPWEFFPTEIHKSGEFWKALFYRGMGQTALLRNVTRFAKLGLFEDVKFAGDVAMALSNPEAIAKGRMHPIQYLNALYIYKKGNLPAGGMGYGYGRQVSDWNVNAKVAGALEKGFYAAFGNVVPSGKVTMVSLDVSGSMTWEGPAGLVGLNAMEASLAMALVTVRTEPYVEVNAFSNGLTRLNISDTATLDDAMREIGRLSFGGTNIGLPIETALKDRKYVDTFVVYTDSEVNTGYHVPELLTAYRKKVNPEARLIVVGMTATEFTVNDSDDTKSLAVTGFDSAAPGIMADFSAGRL